jgi:hypothetical protein
MRPLSLFADDTWADRTDLEHHACWRIIIGQGTMIVQAAGRQAA